jgi:hypothetical protein
MALADSRGAIGAVGELLRTQLANRTEVATVDVGRVGAGSGSCPKFNLFLYQLDLDGPLRNRPLDAGQPVPLWIVLRYLLTAFDGSGDSDSPDAHGLLGAGILALQELNFQRPAGAALADNPEPLKITFDAADTELLSKIMQGGNDSPYRLSAAFQVRPVLIASGEPPAYAPLVHSVGAPVSQGVTVIPSLGPRLDVVDPARFEAGATLSLRGGDLTSALQWVCLGATCYPVTAAPAGGLRTGVPETTSLSPGSYPITAVQELRSGRRIASNAVVGELLPTLQGAVPVTPLSDDGFGRLWGTLTLSGVRLGGPSDQIFVAFWRDGAVALMLEANGSEAQDALSVSVGVEDALPPGPYRVILRVNGSQASNAPQVDWS